jgi:hypothetical protein
VGVVDIFCDIFQALDIFTKICCSQNCNYIQALLQRTNACGGHLIFDFDTGSVRLIICTGHWPHTLIVRSKGGLGKCLVTCNIKSYQVKNMTKIAKKSKIRISKSREPFLVVAVEEEESGLEVFCVFGFPLSMFAIVFLCSLLITYNYRTNCLLLSFAVCLLLW